MSVKITGISPKDAGESCNFYACRERKNVALIDIEGFMRVRLCRPHMRLMRDEFDKWLGPIPYPISNRTLQRRLNRTGMKRTKKI